MLRRMQLWLVLSVACGLALLPRPAYACTMFDRPLIERFSLTIKAYFAADSIYVGMSEVQSTNDGYETVSFKPSYMVWKGYPPNRISIHKPIYFPGSCNFSYIDRNPYLIYVYQNEGLRGRPDELEAALGDVVVLSSLVYVTPATLTIAVVVLILKIIRLWRHRMPAPSRPT